MLYTNWPCFLDRVLTFKLLQLLSHSKTVGSNDQPLGPDQGSFLELFDMSPLLLHLQSFLLFFAERGLLGFASGCLRGFRLRCLARLERGRSSRERIRLEQGLD